MPTDSKFKLRQKFREIRQHIPMLYRSDAAQAAAKLLVNQTSFKQSQSIACYLPFKDEFDTSPLIEAIWLAKKECYLPLLLEEKEKTLRFVQYQYGDSLRPNRFSILEPAIISQVIAPENLDLVITPLIAFDRKGHRLGTGGGYYDYTFAFLHSHPQAKPQMIGAAYAAQEAELLPSDPWDILLDEIVTEKEIIKTAKLT